MKTFVWVIITFIFTAIGTNAAYDSQLQMKNGYEFDLIRGEIRLCETRWKVRCNFVSRYEQDEGSHVWRVRPEPEK